MKFGLRLAKSTCGLSVIFAAWSPLLGQQEAISATRQIRVTVFGEKSQTIRNDLPVEAFELEEDGKPAKVQSLRFVEGPAAVVLLLDCSGSMGGGRRQKVSTSQQHVQVVRSFLEAASPRNEYAVIAFGRRISLLSEFTSNSNAVLSVIQNIPLEGTTSLYDALIEASRMLSSHRAEVKAIVITTDFHDNSSKQTFSKVGEALTSRKILLFSLTSTGDGDLRLSYSGEDARELARRTGGWIFRGSNRQLPWAAHTAAKLLRFRYVVEYSPPDGLKKKDRHDIRVKIRKDVAGEKCAVIAHPSRFE